MGIGTKTPKNHFFRVKLFPKKWYLCKKAKVKLAKLQISYCYVAKCLLPTVKKATIEKRQKKNYK